MARTARQKKLFSTYLIEQNCEMPLFADKDDKDAFIFALCQAIKQYGCLIIGCELLNTSYRLIIYDNGNDISSIMRSINISFSMKLHSKRKFKRRFKSSLLADATKIANYLASFKPIDNSCQLALIKANDLVNSSGFRKRLFRQDSEFCDFIKGQQHTLPCLEANCHNMAGEAMRCMNSTAAKTYINNILKHQQITLNDLKKDKNLRKQHILYLRQHSTLTLKQLGDLFELTESAVSKIIKRANTEII